VYEQSTALKKGAKRKVDAVNEAAGLCWRWKRMGGRRDDILGRALRPLRERPII
jgi:hypothetical protein